jgi:hypothetical protein
MTKLAIFKIEEGNFQEGFKVAVSISEMGKPSHRTIVGKLPPERYERSGLIWCHRKKFSVSNPQGIRESYERWRAECSRAPCRSRGSGKGKAVSVIQLSEKCCQSATDFLDAFKTWLTSENKDFRDFREKLIQEFGPKKTEIRVFIQTEDFLLKKLPWHEWDLFADNSKAELALCATEFQKPSVIQSTDKSKIKILALLGNSEGIDVESDRQALENLKGAETEFLIEPKRAEISESLWEKKWDILFFAGHSSGGEGQIFINSTESLKIEELKAGLEKAIEHGLQLAILNSCDGLKLAEDLADLNIPQVIVMREPVPDRAAQQFLKFFLKAFSSGESLYLAVRQARKRLHETGWDDNCPGVSWLPVIYQNPTVGALNWSIEPSRETTTVSQNKNNVNAKVEYNPDVINENDDSKLEPGIINTLIDLFSYKISGLIAGIGGLSLALVLFIYGYITQADFFTKLTQGQSIILLLSIVGLTFVIAIIGIFAWFAAKVQFKIVLVFMIFVLIIVSFIFVGMIVGENGENDTLSEESQLILATEIFEQVGAPKAARLAIEEAYKLSHESPEIINKRADMAMLELRDYFGIYDFKDISDRAASTYNILSLAAGNHDEQRMADVISHLAWAIHLGNTRQAGQQLLDRKYIEPLLLRAVKADPRNVFAHTFWGTWCLARYTTRPTMWPKCHDNLDEVFFHYSMALTDGRHVSFVNKFADFALDDRDRYDKGLKKIYHSLSKKISGRKLSENQLRQLVTTKLRIITNEQ